MRIGMIAMAAALLANADTVVVLRGADGDVQMVGSIDDLKHVRRAFRDDKDVILWTRIDGDEYVVSDPAVLTHAGEIFRQTDVLDSKQDEIEKDRKSVEERQKALDAETEALDRRQDLLDAEHDRLSDRMSHDLETLVRDAIRSGKARKE